MLESHVSKQLRALHRQSTKACNVHSPAPLRTRAPQQKRRLSDIESTERMLPELVTRRDWCDTSCVLTGLERTEFSALLFSRAQSSIFNVLPSPTKIEPPPCVGLSSIIRRRFFSVPLVRILYTSGEATCLSTYLERRRDSSIPEDEVFQNDMPGNPIQVRADAQMS